MALTAAKHGYRVYLGDKAGINILLNQKLIKKKKSGIYLNKSQFVSTPSDVNIVKKTCEKFLIIDEELGPGMINVEENLIRRTVNDKNISLFFVIGKKIQKGLKKIKKNFDKKVYITGWPKYDLYRNKFKNLFEHESLKIKKKHGNFILVISNFGAISKVGLRMHTNNLRKKIDFKNKKVSLKKDVATLTQYYEDYLNFVKNFKLFLKENKTKKFIIRPHPSDYFHSVWIKEFKNYPNVNVIYDNDIVPWIKASNAIVHRGCSTAIDAFLLKKKIYFYLPSRKLKQKEKNLTYILSKKINNFSEIQRDKKYKSSYFKSKKKFEEEIFFPKNLTSSDSIIKAINGLNIKKTEKHEKIKFLRNFKEYVNFVLRKIKIKNDMYSIKVLNKFPNIITKSYILKKTSLLFPKSKFKIRELGYNLFEIDS